MNDESELKPLLCLNRLQPDDTNMLRHQLAMGDLRILPEDIGRINHELAWGASLSELKGKGLL